MNERARVQDPDLGAETRGPVDLPATKLTSHEAAADLMLVQRAQQGDLTAYDELIRRYQERIYSTVYHMLSNHDDASDLTQETFIKGFQALKSFKGDSSFYTWVYRIAVNKTINFIKSRRNKSHLSLNDMDFNAEHDPDMLSLVSERTPRRDAECKGKPSILYEARPHLGSNRLPAVVKALRQRIEALGGEVRFSCRVEDFDFVDGKVRGLGTSSGYIAADAVIVAIGHSARDTYEVLHRRGVPMVPKPFQMGVRIEHPQELVNRVQYGTGLLEAKLGSADYSLVARGPHDLFTFCMCAGGFIMPSVSEPGHFCTNGMSLSRRDSPYANSGLVITIGPADFGGTDPLAGVRLQQRSERAAFQLGGGEYACPVQLATDFLAGRASGGLPSCSYPRQSIAVGLGEFLPPVVLEALEQGLPQLDRRWQGRFLPEAVLVGPESRGSSPVRILRDDSTREAPGLCGLFPIGEGAGYAGGIVSAAIDGLRTAKAIVAKYAPFSR